MNNKIKLPYKIGSEVYVVRNFNKYTDERDDVYDIGDNVLSKIIKFKADTFIYDKEGIHLGIDTHGGTYVLRSYYNLTYKNKNVDSEKCEIFNSKKSAVEFIENMKNTNVDITTKENQKNEEEIYIPNFIGDKLYMIRNLSDSDENVLVHDIKNSKIIIDEIIVEGFIINKEGVYIAEVGFDGWNTLNDNYYFNNPKTNKYEDYLLFNKKSLAIEYVEQLKD